MEILKNDKKFFLYPHNCDDLSIVAQKELHKLNIKDLKGIKNEMSYNVLYSQFFKK